MNGQLQSAFDASKEILSVTTFAFAAVLRQRRRLQKCGSVLVDERIMLRAVCQFIAGLISGLRVGKRRT